MDKNGWTAFDVQEPEASACLEGFLLIFHVFRGVLAEPWEKRHDTPMFTHWKSIPHKGWTDARKRIPTAADGDIAHCILARSETDGFRVTGWHQLERNPHYTHWMPTPEPPEDAAEYRRRF